MKGNKTLKLMKKELQLDLLNPHLHFRPGTETFHESSLYPAYETGQNDLSEHFSTYHHYTFDPELLELHEFNEYDFTRHLLPTLILLHERINSDINDKDTLNYTVQVKQHLLDGNPTIEYIITTTENM